MTTNAIGIDLAFQSNTYVRNHLGLAHQWESARGYAARGFRIDLISLGYPIPLVTSKVRLDLEPILNVLRGEIMFVNDGGGRLLRVESGFSLELSATVRQWFLTVQAFGIDFRYWVYSQRPVGDRVFAGDSLQGRDRPRILSPGARGLAREPPAPGGVPPA